VHPQSDNEQVLNNICISFATARLRGAGTTHVGFGQMSSRVVRVPHTKSKSSA
jgi:hypothetical protein